MVKARFDGFDFEWNGGMSPEDFIENNLGYYSEKAIEIEPTQAYMINDGEIDTIIAIMSIEDVKKNMAKVYLQILNDNY